jgi:hypothetical protein
MTYDRLILEGQISENLPYALQLESQIDDLLRTGITCEDPLLQPLHNQAHSVALTMGEADKLIVREVGMHYWIGRIMTQERPYENPEFIMYVNQKNQLATHAKQINLDQRLVASIVYALPNKTAKAISLSA